MTMSDAAVQIDYEGNIRAFIPFTAEALCPINVKHFPFDTQICQFKVMFHISDKSRPCEIPQNGKEGLTEVGEETTRGFLFKSRLINWNSAF